MKRTAITNRVPFIACIVVSLAIAVLALGAATPSTARVGTLAEAGQMLDPRSGHSATLLPNGKVLIVGGMRRNQDFYKSAELYDPATGKFQPTGEMNERRVGHAAVFALGQGADCRRMGRIRGHGFGRVVRSRDR